MGHKEENKKIIYILAFLAAMFSNVGVILAEDTTKTSYVVCGNNLFPAPVASIIRILILVLQLIVPIGIIIMGSLDFLKATIAGDSSAMKKNQKKFVSRLVAGVVTFFVFVIVKFIISISAEAQDTESFSACLDCLVNDKDSCALSTEKPFN